MRSRLSGVYLAVGKLADITFDLKRIFFDISLVRKFEEAIFRLALRFFNSIFRLPWRIVVEISFNCRANASKYRSKVRRYFEENKARNSSKFALITFAQYCTSEFRAHSVRGASTSKAKAKGLSCKEIMEIAKWRKESTFRRHYLREVACNKQAQDSFQAVVLQG